MCRPKFLPPNSCRPYLKLKKMIHPCVEITGGSAKEFVANDTIIGGNDHPSVIIVTGPNMGGKSTLLRQTWFV